ncbi:ABC transporter substrate-binding protein [Bradyrhizobium yuanmingense]|uniref:ABC transporter substrate-binding protein n=1 Tax=Bradyrhizobium yuanmingense TaxID=108015 RepID=UPI0012FCAAA6|nr:ABC transporter substrate-binding protein [Bradyrhizobium yuanmingense]MVT55644.1 ABC transporter substrate-binding protein [Bradyrhizobium yuanmingense]
MRGVTRRTLVKGGLAVAGTLSAPRLVLGQRLGGKTVKAVMGGDIPTYDPIWTTANQSAYHGVMVYDTLFGVDAQQNPQPQMVGKYGLSDNKLTWTFELRDGLKFYDGTGVTTADVIPSIRRWAARDSFGQQMMRRVKEISAKDEKTFTIELKERYGLVLHALAKTVPPLCFIMRKKEAETDPMQKIDTVIGSGPFKFNVKETKPGTQYVYDRNPDYVPRREPPSGIAGGKIVKVDRVVYINMPDPQTAVAAVQAGEIDFYESPPTDLLGQLSEDKNLKIQTLNEAGYIGIIRLNFLHPPFNNEKCRQAILHIVKQLDYLEATVANPKYYKLCSSLFGCGTPMENDANTGWFKTAPDYAKARQLLKEGGYDGRSVVLLQPTSMSGFKNASEILAAEMRQAGINVQMEPMDWSNVVTRRAVKAPPEQGGWNIIITAATGTRLGNPLDILHQSNGDQAWFGWPSNAKNEELRTDWALAETLEERKRIAREIQQNAWNYVPQVLYGLSVSPVVMRSNVNGILPVPEVIPWWNVDKT